MTEGEINQVSEAIGRLRAEVRGLSKLGKDNRAVADQRHHENQTQLKDIADRMGAVEIELIPLVTAVDKMQPVVENYKQNKLKLIGALMLASAILTGIGWLVINVVVKLGALLWAAIPNIK